MRSVMRARWARWARPALVTLIALIAVVAAWLTICIIVLGHPRTERPTKADAIVVLGEPVDGALVTARELAREGISNEMLLLIPFGPVPDCTHPPADVHVDCVIPNPKTTQGDAESIRDIALERNWRHIVVITWTAHISRSRLLINRCFDGQVQMVDYDNHDGTLGWLGEFVHQTAGYLKATINRSC